MVNFYSFKNDFLKHEKDLYFIAEIGINHNGSYDMAKRMIDKSLEAGASAVKFQKRNWKSLLLPGLKPEQPYGYLSSDEFDLPKDKKAFGSWAYPDTRLELKDDEILKLWKYSNKKGLEFIISPWDEKSVDFLVKHKAKVIKLASIDARNYHFCKYIAKTRIPTIISTGMCNYDEILKTKNIFDKFSCPVMFLHCASSYPSSLKDKNLNCIPVLRDLLSTEIGFSGHGTGFEGTVGAVALGCRVIEKHVTLNKEMAGPDHAASLNFEQFKELILMSNNIFECLGSKEKKFLDSEKILHSVLGKKFYIKKDLKSGHRLNYNDLRTAVTRSSKGITPEKFYMILNKKLTKNKNKNDILEYKDINFE